jgi:hypothetical protein
MKCLQLFLILQFYCCGVTAQLSFSGIPDSLISGADAIVIDQLEKLEIFNKNKCSYSITSKSLILKNSDNNLTNIMIFYDQFTKVDALEIVIKDINGKKLKTIKRKDFQDEAAYDGFSIANDSRYLTYHILGIPTPYIIEKKYQQVLDSNIQFARIQSV